MCKIHDQPLETNIAFTLTTAHVLLSPFSYIMERVQMVMVGAEGIVENGGIINKVCISCFFVVFLVEVINVYLM